MGVPDLDGLLTRQSGVLTRAQARSCGLTDAGLQARLDAGHWQRVLPRVYATRAGALSRPEWLSAVLLYAGDGAALSHQTAAELHGLAPADGVVHVTIPAGRRTRGTGGVRVYRSHRLDETQVHPLLVPRRTRVERTVLDLMDAAPDIDRAFAWMADACQKKLTSALRLRAALMASPEIRRRSVLLWALGDIATGGHSLLERQFLGLVRRHGLPAPRQQVRVVSGRRTHWVDCDYGELRTRVELDGHVGHDLTLDRLRDMQRDNLAATADVLPLRYGWPDVVDRPCSVASQVASVLQLRGWTGTPRRCGRECGL